MLFKKLKAVSYVEVILVLVIVGVISSISIPALKKHSQKNELGRLTQSAFLRLNQAVDNSILLNGPTRNWSVANSGDFFKYLLPSFMALSKGSAHVVTKDKMQFSINSGEVKSYTTITVDVNGTSVGPNKTGKDIHLFQIKHSNGTVEPIGDTLTLAQNGWKFTDALWYK